MEEYRLKKRKIKNYEKLCNNLGSDASKDKLKKDL